MAVRRFAAINGKSRSRNRNAGKQGAEGRRRRLNLEPLESRRLLTATLYDISNPNGASATINSAIFQESAPNTAAGSGHIDSFLRVQNSPSEQGFNSDATPTLDAKGGRFTRALALNGTDGIPTVVLSDGIAYREFILDINQTGGGLLKLDRLQLYLTDSNVLTNYNVAAHDFTSPQPAGANVAKISDMDAGGDNSVLLANNGSGSGKSDMVLYVPDSLFAASFANANFVTLYCEFGSNPDQPNATAAGGFEEWAVDNGQVASPTITTNADPMSVTLDSGGSPTLKDSATLFGGVNPTGTITFTLYDPGNTAVDTETVAVNGNGTYSTPTGYTLPVYANPGTCQWVASYSGDDNNYSVSSDEGDEPVVVNAASPTIGTTANPTIVTLDSSGSPTLNDSATLSGGFDPIGTITFTLYSPANTVIDTETATVNGNGTYGTPTGFTLPIDAAPGTYQWLASYGGDGNNNAVSSKKGDEPVIVSAASPTISTTANPSSVTLGSSAPPVLNDSATLSGGFNPVGTITFFLYSPIDALIDTETATVNGNGTYSTPSGFTPPTNRTVTGTFQWVATYSGDGNNNSVCSKKGDEPVIVHAACPTITTTPGGTVVIGSGTKLTDSATLAAGFHETGLITFKLYNPSNVVVDTETATVNGNGVYHTPTGFLPIVAGTYQWVATYGGDGNNNSVASAKGDEPELVKAQVIVVAMDKSPTTPQSVEVVDGSTGAVLSQFIPYGNTFQGGIRIATGDLLGNGVDEIVTAPGRDATPLIKIYSETGVLLTSFLAYSSSNTGGVNVTIADVNGDGKPDIITVPSQGTAEVKVFLNQSVGGTVSFKTTPYKDFLAFPSTMISGAVIAAADMGHMLANGTFTNGLDGKAEIVVGTGPGTAASVRVFDVSGTPTLVRSFAPFTAGFNGGVFLATGQLSSSDPAPAIVVGAGVNGGSKVEVWDWKAPNATLFKLTSFSAYTDASKNAPVHVAVQDFNGDGLVDAILTSQGPGGATGQIRAFTIAGGQLGTLTGFNFPSFVAAIGKPDPSLFAPKPVVTTALKPLTTSLTSPTAGDLLSNFGSLSPSVVDQLFASLGLGLNTGLSNLLGPIKTGLAGSN